MNVFAFSKKPATKIYAVIDIGSESVSGGIFEKYAESAPAPQSGAGASISGKPKFLYTASEPISFQKILTGENLFGAMRKSLDMVLFHLQKYGIEHIKKASKPSYHLENASVFMSSPWHISETKVIKLTHEKPMAITKKLIDDLLATEEKELETKFEIGKSKDALDTLEQKIVEARLDGYPTSVPVGRNARSLELHLFTSIAQRHTLEFVKKAVRKSLNFSDVSFHTFSLASFVALRDTFSQMADFLIIQIGGEVSDMTIVKKGQISETVSFPLGHNHLFRALHKICGNHPHCTLEALLALHLEQKIESRDKKRVEQAILETKTAWLGFLEGSLTNFSGETFLPKTVFLFEDAPSTSTQVFAEFLGDPRLSKLTATAEPFTVNVVDENLAGHFAESQPNALISPNLAIGASFVVRHMLN